MKKILLFLMVVALLLAIMPMSALADTSYNGSVSGIITNDDLGNISGSVTGNYNLTFNGQFTGQTAPFWKTFIANVTGDITGVVEGIVCVNGFDSMFAQFTSIDGYTGSDPVYIVGCFPKSGIKGDFEGEIITGALPADVTSLSITIEGDATTVDVGSTLQCNAVTVPSGPYDILWSIWTSDGINRASIDQNGLVTALQAGEFTVIANSLDPALATTTKVITAENPQTEVNGDVDPSYVIVIPATVDFGTMVKGSGLKSQDFAVEAKNVVLEDGYSIKVSVSSSFAMKDKDGSGSVMLHYILKNSVPTQMTSGAVFTTFTDDGIETGEISVNTDNITKAGSYKGTMDFTIVYE